MAEQRDHEHLTQLQRAERALDNELSTALDRLHTVLPQYPELTAPVPIAIDAVAQLLHTDEALLSLFTLPDRVLIWLIRPGQAFLYHEVVVPRPTLVEQVTRIRASLDQQHNAGLAAMQFQPFDVAGAAELYTLLVEPLRPALAGVQHLLVVPDEVFLPLPFGVLVTQTQGEAYQAMAQWHAQQHPLSPQQPRGYTQLAWLAREYAITVLPAATSLRALRHFARQPGVAREPLIGFGDPQLTPSAPVLPEGPAEAQRSRGFVDAVRQLQPLPGTRLELQTLAAELQANPSVALYLGNQATKAELRALNATGRLAAAQVLAFATHATRAKASGSSQCSAGRPCAPRRFLHSECRLHFS